jgi:energy-coupling factor transport system substrate-specific component
MATTFAARVVGRRRAAIRIRVRSTIAVVLATFIGFVCFLWPFLLAPGRFGSAYTAPLMFGVLLLLVLAVVFAEIADGGIDAKALAMLGV